MSCLAKFSFTNTNNSLESIEFYVYYVSPKGFPGDGNGDGGSRPGVADVAKNKALSAYPNPATTNVTVEYNVGNNSILMVTDVYGRIILTENIANQGKITVDRSLLKSGTYILQIFQDRKKILVTKLIIA